MKPVKPNKPCCIILSIILSWFSASFSHSAVKANGVTHVSQAELLEKTSGQNEVIIIDVREAKEYNSGHVPGAINLPRGVIVNNITVLDDYKDKDLVFYCHSGKRAKMVTDHLVNKNYSDQLFHLQGDMRAWRANGQTIAF